MYKDDELVKKYIRTDHVRNFILKLRYSVLRYIKLYYYHFIF